MIKVLKKELLIYLAILVALSLFMHPERISMIESPFQLVHTVAWSFGVYVGIVVLRWIVSVVLKVFKRKKAES